MPLSEALRHLTYLAMEAYFIGGVAFVLWIVHFPFLWSRRRPIAAGTLIVSAYALPVDAWAVARGWGGFNPAYVTGIYLFGRSLLLEEVVFWLGTVFVTVSAVLLFAELERRGVPWWMLPGGVFLPLSIMERAAAAVQAGSPLRARAPGRVGDRRGE
jgi:lycopene cyclase domain-containing protein